MAKIEAFLISLRNQFKNLENFLTKILKEEESLHDDVLKKKGFIIHSYSINYGAVNFDVLSDISSELNGVIKKESYILDELSNHSDDMEQLASDYDAVHRKKLHINLLEKYLKEAFYYCKLMMVRIKQLKVVLEEDSKLHKKSLPKKTEIFFASFENVANKILKFMMLLEQLLQKISNFEDESYYPTPKTYGRVMSAKEFKKTLSEGKLSSSKDPTPVFDAPRSVMEKIKSMTKDQLKNFFGQIGVAAGVHVVFFQTKLKPFNHDTPIPQSNGLREYKFPKGEKIDILEAA